jgi:hypothetical protein
MRKEYEKKLTLGGRAVHQNLVCSSGWICSSPARFVSFYAAEEIFRCDHTQEGALKSHWHTGC